MKYAVIDCGTTNTRVYIVDREGKIIASGERRVGVRNTSMTGSKDTLRNGLCEAIEEAAANAKIALKDISFAIASGMITSEIGLIELPHLIAPVGLEDLAAHAELVSGRQLLPLDIPILFIRGIRNDYGENATLRDIRNVDFMRGEETQMIGIMDEFDIHTPTNVIVLSSHTKLIHINAEQKVTASLTSISGQLYEAVCSATMVGKSLTEEQNEQSGGYTFEEIVAIAKDVVENVGLDRCFLIPRFMQVLLKTDYKERRAFIDAAIAIDDLKMLQEFERQNNRAARYILFGQKSRCDLYERLISQMYAGRVQITKLSDKEILSELTVKGAIKIANEYTKTRA